MDALEVCYMSAGDLSKLVQSQEVSPVEIIDAHLARIEETEPVLNSFITLLANESRAAARQAEKDIQAGRYKGPLHGIPVGLKDLYNTGGVRTTSGSKIFDTFIPAEDCTVAAKFQQAGAILLGKLNMSEFAMGDAFEHPYGRPHNPWDLSRNPGTSSSGSGAATAAFLCATSLGEDTGGSIRGPASFCGLVGIRPSWGRVSRHGVLGASWSMDQVGPISRTVADCAITLGAIAGHDPKDGHTWDVPVPDYLAELADGVEGLKIGVITERVEGDAVDPQVRDLVVKAIAQLGELGAAVSHVDIPLIAQSAAISTAVTYGDVSGVHREGIDNRLKEYDYNIQLRLLAGAILPAQAHQKAVRLRHMLRQQIFDALEQVDVLVMPTSSIPASPIPEKAGVESKEAFMEMLSGRRSFTAPFNLASVPALSINCGFTPEDLPVGLQIVGKPFDESTVFQVAHAYEKATTWNTRRPPVS